MCPRKSRRELMEEWREKRKKIMELLDSGMGVKEISEKFGLTRQRIYQIRDYERRQREAGDSSATAP